MRQQSPIASQTARDDSAGQNSNDHNEFLQAAIVWLPRLQRYAQSLCRDPARAEDLVHDTVLRACAKRRYYTPGTNLCAWLLTIMRNCFISQLRHRSFEREDPEGMYSAQLASSPEHDAHLRMGDLQRAWSCLPIHQQHTLELVCIDGLSQCEVARICGVAVGTVKSRVGRAREHLAQLMSEDTSSRSRRG
jgi:RNA polymerase sigma-70 factor, ECF subfamily